MAVTPFATGTRIGEGLAIDTEYLVNCYAQFSETGKSAISLITRPGLNEVNDYGANAARGIYVAGDSVSGYTIYAVHRDILTKLTVSGPPQFLGKLDTNQNPVWIGGNGDQVLVADGQFGYVYTDSTSSFVKLNSGTHGWTLVQPRWVAYLSGYLIVVDAEDNSYNISGIKDALTWSAADKAFAETDPDGIAALHADNGELFIFGQNTLEVHYNSGAADFPFAPKLGATQEWGAAAPFSVAPFDSSLAYLAQSKRGGLRVMRLVGYQPQRISDDGIERLIAEYDTVSDAVGFGMDWGGHAFYWLTFPTQNVTWVYDQMSNTWFEARSSGGRFLGDRFVGGGAAGRENATLATDYRNGKLYIFAETNSDGAAPIHIEARGKTLNENEERIEHNSLQIVLEHGTAPVSSVPQAMLRWSNDNARTWSHEYWREVGRVGQYQARARWNRLGTARNRTYHIRITEPVPRKIVGMVVNGRT